MADNIFENLATPTVTATAQVEGADVIARFKGVMREEPSQSALGKFVDQLHKKRAGAARVVLDFRQLSFMNSSAIKQFAMWIDRIKNLPPPERYRLHIITLSGSHWQRTSCGALQAFGPDIVTLEVAAAP